MVRKTMMGNLLCRATAIRPPRGSFSRDAEAPVARRGRREIRAGRSVRLTTRLIKIPVPEIRPSSETPE
jgi:hypothetical protein